MKTGRKHDFSNSLINTFGGRVWTSASCGGNEYYNNKQKQNLKKQNLSCQKRISR